jgi:benzoyl-CoA reductase subunit C
MDALETLRDAARHPSRAAEDWRAQGGKVVGYRCLYVPEEIIAAAGMLPHPLYGTPEPVGVADAYLQSCVCEAVRNLLDLALQDRLPRLDALALPNTCDAIRRLCDVWAAYVPATPVCLLDNPQKLGTAEGRAYLLEELRRFRARMEEISGRRVTDEALRDAVALRDETRDLLARIYDLRRADRPPLTAEESFDVCLAAAQHPGRRAKPLLRRLLDDLGDRTPPDEGDGPRLLVTGSLVDHPGLLELVREAGGRVVVEDLCTTTRTFWHRVEADGDPLEAICRSLDRRVLCACMHPVGARLEHILGLVDRFRVDAVIEFNLKYCHPFLYEAPLVRRALEAREVPVTMLEVGHDRSGYGQLRTRIQAFIEMVGP